MLAWWSQIMALVVDRRVSDAALREKLKTGTKFAWRDILRKAVQTVPKTGSASAFGAPVPVDVKANAGGHTGDIDAALGGLRSLYELREELLGLKTENKVLKEQRKAILKKLKKYNAFYEQVLQP